VANLFDRLAQGQPPQEPQQEPTPRRAQELLHWLRHVWTQPTIRARDICRLGPNAIRDRKSALNSAEILADHGWLTPIKTRRCDMKEWQITKGLPLIRTEGNS
jgi:hypothetical protein